ncbi:MAG: Hint domain-containing protein [Pseudomonadota bacterium]|nr:Hint domain-containing protein [Pseudomonadota bacterium]
MFGKHDTQADRVARHMAGDFGTATGEAYRTTGLVAGTRIATAMGWRAVEAIAVGDLVLTFDHGLQPVVAVTRTPVAARLRPSSQTFPVHVPAGALGNATPMTLLPEQSVVVESDAAEALFADPFAVLKARDLIGYAGIDHADPLAVDEVLTLHFAEDQVLHADGGALIVATADIPGETTLAFLTHARTPAPYATYDGQAARMLVSLMTQPDARLGEGGLLRPAA